MLSDILLIILGLYACFSPFIVLKAVKFGIKCADKPEEAVLEPIFTLPEKKNSEVPPVPEQMQRDFDILANIETFDGTSVGQKEII